VLERLARWLKLERNETRRALVLGVILGAITGSYTLAKTVRDAFFLTRLSVTVLPYLYVGIGALAALAATGFARVTRHRPLWESLATATLGAAISLAVSAQLLRIHAAWVPIAFYLWVNVYGLILISQFWLFANDLSHAHEAKRIFGVVGVGAILGGLVGGLIAAPLARLWSLPTLLSVAALLQASVMPLVCLRSHRSAADPEPPPSVATGASPLSHSYVRWLALATLCSVMVAAVLDYQLKAQVQARYATAGQVASFFGFFYTLTNLAALMLQLFATRWLVQRVGASWSASLAPAGLAVTAALTIAAPGLGPVTAGRVWDQVTRFSIGKAAGELFYFPLEPGLRRRTKAMIQAGLERVGDGFAGLVILGVGATMGAGTRELGIVVAVLVALWALAWLGVRRGYVLELGHNLRRLHLDHGQMRISLREARVLEELIRLLASPYERVVLHGIEMLAEIAPEEFEDRFDDLLQHRSPRARARALEIGRLRQTRVADERLAALMRDDDPEVRVQALSVWCSRSGEDLITPLHEFLRGGDERLRVAAILCLAEQAPARQEDRVRVVLEEWLEKGGTAERVAVAEGLGRRAAPSELHDLLAPLLRDRNLPVRRAALRSAGVAERRTHVPVLIEALGAAETEEPARFALARLADRVVGTLGDYLADSSVAAPIRHALPRVLGDIHSQESVNALFRCRERGDVRLAYRILKAANRLRVSGARLEFPRRRITEEIEYDVRGFLFALVHYRACPIGRGRSAERLLCMALNERMEQALNRVFRRLGLLYPPEELLAAYRGVVSDHPRLRGNALEYLENALTLEHRALVMPLVDDSGDEGRLRVAEIRYGMRFASFESTLEAILGQEDPWLRACALYVVGARKERSLLPFVESSLSTVNPLVRETASWARLALATG